MYLTRAGISNVRSIKRFDIGFNKDELAGWHVLLGDNGSGKSSVIRSLALALIGPSEAAALRQNWAEWLREGTNSGEIVVRVEADPDLDRAARNGAKLKRTWVDLGVSLGRQITPVRRSRAARGARARAARLGAPQTSVTLEKTKTDADASRTLWGNGRGWYCASFGPFRRFSGGDKAYEKLFWSNPKLAPHLSAFGEDVALTECLSWLQKLHVLGLERDAEFIADAEFISEEEDAEAGERRGDLIGAIRTFLNESGLLPHGARLEEVRATAVVFRDGNDCLVPVDQLSDGYRSVLSLTFELIRQMVRSYGERRVLDALGKGRTSIDLPGVVLIDEIDAHLHPSWQQKIGHWFCRCFPKLQFIVTTHSPFVCQAAVRGTVWKLPSPGTDDKVRRIEGTELQRLLFGNILDAYGTDLFGMAVSRSQASKEKLQRLAALNRKRLQAELTPDEESERQELKQALPTASTVTAGR